MADLKPTPARLDLLRAVAAGRVSRTRALGDDIDWSRRPERKVSAVIGKLADAGWVRLHLDRSSTRSHPWKLTDTGRAVLAAADTEKEHNHG